MSSEERKKILQMVEEGKISAEQAARLMRALATDVDSADVPIEVLEVGAGSNTERIDAPEFEEVICECGSAKRARLAAEYYSWISIALEIDCLVPAKFWT